jgi:hypothetical protein
MDLTQLEGLKQRLVKTEQFDSVAQDFAIGASDDTTFLELGELVDNDLLAGVIHAAGRECFGQDSRIERMTLIRIDSAHFIHGAFILGGRMANVMYFEDVGIGVVSIAALSPEPTTEFVRFAARPHHDPSWN